jgi:hypothetical protein
VASSLEQVPERNAAAQERSLSVTSNLGAKPCFLSGLLR